MPVQKNPVAPAWWKFGHVWLVISGPAIVVVASFITLYLAVTRPDPVIGTSATRQAGPAVSRAQANMAPAVQGRNHAATGVLSGERNVSKP